MRAASPLLARGASASVPLDELNELVVRKYRYPFIFSSSEIESSNGKKK